MRSSPRDEQFRRTIREWLADNLTGRFAALRDAAEPTEGAGVIAFSASDHTSYLTGEVISVDSPHP